jgi:NitT/TauT family transport system ATP-binding protein
VTKRQLHDVLLDLWRETSTTGRRTVLFVTHDVDESLLLADRVIVIKNGRLVDDLRIGADRPRNADSLTAPEMMAAKHTLLAHLGLERNARHGASA